MSIIDLLFGGGDLTPQKIRQLVNDERALLLDVRTPDEFRASCVKGSVNIPIDEIEARVAEIPTDRPIIVYCASGARSAAVQRYLSQIGYSAVHNARVWSRVASALA